MNLRLVLIVSLAALLAAGAVAFLANRGRSPAGSSGAASGPPVRSESPGRAAVRTVVLDVEGMHCDGCVRRIAEFLEKTPGVVSAAVSLEEKRAVVGLSTNDLIEERLIEAVVAAGYGATVSPE